MPNKEKVIEGLEHCDFGSSSTCYEKECPYYQDHDCTDELKDDILALLKEHESVEPDQTEHIVFGTNRKCSTCGKYLFPAGKFCPHCGRSVKWE